MTRCATSKLFGLYLFADMITAISESSAMGYDPV
jgi:hypothetical protein